MKKIIVFALSMVLMTGWLSAQEGRAGTKDRLKAMRVEFFTQKLALTDAEATKFFPVYDQYDAERRALRQEYWGGRKGGVELSEAEAEEQIEGSFEAQEKELALKKKYYEKFKTVIPVEKLAQLPKVEKAFRAQILKAVKERRKGRGREH